jgi:hypothetical protein
MKTETRERLHVRNLFSCWRDRDLDVVTIMDGLARAASDC